MLQGIGSLYEGSTVCPVSGPESEAVKLRFSLVFFDSSPNQSNKPCLMEML